jgi:hypothetical protein
LSMVRFHAALRGRRGSGERIPACRLMTPIHAVLNIAPVARGR